MRAHNREEAAGRARRSAARTTPEFYHTTAPLSTTFLCGLFSRVRGALNTASTPEEERLILLLLDRLARFKYAIEQGGRFR